MSENKKKFLPKLKKKIKGFLTEESWKISKKDALGLSVGAMLLAEIDGISEAVHTSSYPHSNWVGAHINSSCSATATANMWTLKVNHASWIINWHYSDVPSTTWAPGATANLTYSHGSWNGHNSHANHSSHDNY
jgi:hypothetical protein